MLLYFIPDARAFTPQTLSEHGLDGVIDRPARREVMRGPTGSAGLLIAQAGIPIDRLVYDDDRHVWRRRPGTEAWVGYDPDHRPTPAELQRPTLVPGPSLELGDGCRWVIPQLRTFDPNQLSGPISYTCSLDRVLDQDPETGNLVPGDVVPCYTSIWNTGLQIGQAMFDQLRSDGRATSAGIDNAVLDDFCADLLSLNYRVEKTELALLRLLTLNLSAAVMRAALDWDTLQANLGNRLRRAVRPGAPNDSIDGSTESGEMPATVA